MFLYFYLLAAAFFRDNMQPALARSHRLKNFAPCHDLCRYLLAENSTIPQDALIRAVLAGLEYDRTLWHGLVGECLVHGAHDIPRLQTAPATFACLLAPEHRGQADVPRHQYAPIEQAHFGTRDLAFGAGYYRPDHAGLNDLEDVRRLNDYLQAVNTSAWSASALQGLATCPTDEDRAEELADARAWWPSLVELYRNARDRELVIICETV